jgi:uncharacterized spore protein YtfJ
VPPGRDRQTFDAPTLRRLAARLSGARLCYGKPVEAAGRTVIPVASLRTVGGLGFGRGPTPDSSGGGGGGALEARPIGFIDVGPDGAHFQSIDDGYNALRLIASGTVAALILRRMVRRRGPRRWLTPPRPGRPLRPSPRRSLPR